MNFSLVSSTFDDRQMEHKVFPAPWTNWKFAHGATLRNAGTPKELIILRAWDPNNFPFELTIRCPKNIHRYSEIFTTKWLSVSKDLIEHDCYSVVTDDKRNMILTRSFTTGLSEKVPQWQWRATWEDPKGGMRTEPTAIFTNSPIDALKYFTVKTMLPTKKEDVER